MQLETALASAIIFSIRKHLPDTKRPYKAWTYPIVPALYVIITTLFLINTLIEKPEQSIGGLLIILTGFGVYFGLKGNDK